jgi:hypothetical protein
MRKLDNKGNAAIILCLLITAIFGFTALGLDIGLVYVEKTALTNALDSAALAASLELPNDETKIISIAEEYLRKNNIDPGDVVITIGSDKKSIQIEGNRKVKHLFAPIIGINNSVIYAKTKAVIAPAKVIADGVRPFAVQKFDYVYGDLVTLKEDAGDGYNGNYGPVALGGKGASVFRINTLYGYEGTISVGDYIDTEPGNMASVAMDIQNYINSEQSTYDNFPRDSIRAWVIPIVDTFDINGRGQIKVVGFGKFFVEDVQGQAGQIEIRGRFVKYVTSAVVDNSLSDTGLYGSKLSK